MATGNSSKMAHASSAQSGSQLKNHWYLKMDATEVSRAFRMSEISATELVETAIAIAEEINPRVNAIIHKDYDRALTAAQKLDSHSNRMSLSPLAGVPFLIKDNNLFEEGVPTTFGSRSAKGYIPTRDSDLVALWKNSGLVSIGRSNTPEFATAFTTEPKAYGKTRNPWNLGHTTGGSSGGAAAAVASGIVPAAHGNDAGGSIRIPSSCCGLFGMRPTQNLVSVQPHFREVWHGVNSEHVLTRSVRDSALFLDIATHSSKWTYSRAVRQTPGRLKIGVCKTSIMGGSVDAAVLNELEKSISLLRGLGHDIIEYNLPVTAEDIQCLVLIAAAGACKMYEDIRATFGDSAPIDQLEAFNQGLFALAKSSSAVDFVTATNHMNYVRNTMRRMFADLDIFMSPTLAQEPLELGILNTDAQDFDIEAFLKRSFDFSPFTAPFNVAGLPAMSVPLNVSEAGLPVGMQFAATHHAEEQLFALAGQLETAAPWIERSNAVVSQQFA